MSSTPGSSQRRPGVLSTSEGTHRCAFTALDWTLFASVGGIWGSSFLFIAIGLEAFEPGLITWGRVLCGAAVLWLMPAARTRIERDDRPRLVALSVLWVALPFTLFPIAEQHITSGLVWLLNGAIPISAPFGAWGLGRSSFAWDSLSAVAVLGALGTGMAFVLMGRLVSRVGSTRAAFVNYLIPVVAMILGAVFRNETIRGTSVVGIALVIGGAILASRREASSSAPSAS